MIYSIICSNSTFVTSPWEQKNNVTKIPEYITANDFRQIWC